MWKAAHVELMTIEPSTTQEGAGQSFKINGSGFENGATHFAFVHSSGDGNLPQYRIAPCEDVRVVSHADSQTITFRASFYQREPGTYHLVGWGPTTEESDAQVNNAAVIEHALTVEKTKES
jgi:hypothetical protein